jgi:hypothetical protein
MSDLLPERNVVREYTCQSWTEFTREVRRNRSWPAKENGGIYADKTIFRGHSDPTWRLSSRLERKLEYGLKSNDGAVTYHNLRQVRGLDWYDGICRRILAKFKEHAQGRPGFDPEADEDEIWALGRHYGLITPLLDWTESPYVAAFFALEELHRRLEHQTSTQLAAEKACVHVWGLRFWEKPQVPGEFDVVTASPKAAARQRAQSGLFTRLRSHDHWDVRSYLESRGLAHCLEVYAISGDAAVHGLRDLILMNIHPATLYPDLSGAALQANFASDTLDFGASVLEDQRPEAF